MATKFNSSSIKTAEPNIPFIDGSKPPFEGALPIFKRFDRLNDYYPKHERRGTQFGYDRKSGDFTALGPEEFDDYDEEGNKLPQVLEACPICNKTNCGGVNGRGFGKHGGPCTGCGKEDCVGDLAYYKEEKHRPAGYRPAGFGMHIVDWQEPQVREKKPEVLFTSPEDALKYVLEEQNKNPRQYPIRIRKSTIDRVTKTSAVIRILDESLIIKKVSSLRIFNASYDDGDSFWDPDDYEAQQKKPYEKFSEGSIPESDIDEDDEYIKSLRGLDSLTPEQEEDLADFTERQNNIQQNNLTPYNEEPNYTLDSLGQEATGTETTEEQEPVVACPNCETKSMVNQPGSESFKDDHCKCCDRTCGSTKSNSKVHCSGDPDPSVCPGRPREQWSQGKGKNKITVCPVCQNEGFIPESKATSLSEATPAENIPQAEPTPGNEPIPAMVHDPEGEDFTPDEIDGVIPAAAANPIVEKTPIVIPTGVVSPAEALRLKKQKIDEMSKADRPSGVTLIKSLTPETKSFSKPIEVRTLPQILTPKQKSCGCRERSGLLPDEEIAKIKQSKEYNDGIAKIKAQGLSQNEMRMHLNHFIATQTLCTECKD